MGGTCSRLVSVKTSKAFNNKVHSLSLSQDGAETVEGNKVKPIKDDDSVDKNLDRVTTEEQTVEVEPPDIFSNGDHKRNSSKVIEVNIDRVEQYVSLQNNFERGDYKIEDKSDPNSCHKIIEVGENPRLQGASPNVDGKQNMISQDGENDDIDRSQDSNDNSYNGHPSESELKYNIDIDSNCDEPEDNSVPLAPRDAVAVTQFENEAEEKQDDPVEFDSIPQDSLFFLPLDNDQQRTPVTYRIPERLNRSRKPPLSYSERMLLADCNRFQQLDKKREFAVRRNRSISRIGKLPKINGESSESTSKASKTLNKPDD